jgi:hypothetical protein
VAYAIATVARPPLRLILSGNSVWQAYEQVQQAQLNRALIAAAKQNDAEAVISLLAKGADVKARDLPPDTRSFWQRLWDRLRGKQTQKGYAPSVLLVAMDVRGGTGEYPEENVALVSALCFPALERPHRRRCQPT